MQMDRGVEFRFIVPVQIHGSSETRSIFPIRMHRGSESRFILVIKKKPWFYIAIHFLDSFEFRF